MLFGAADLTSDEVLRGISAVAWIVCLWALVFGGLGHWLGSRRGNGRAGFYLGLFLGPLGWIIAVLLAPPVEAGPKYNPNGPKPEIEPEPGKVYPFCAETIKKRR